MRTIRKVISPGALLAALALVAVACSGGLDIRQSYSFDLVTMPVQKSISEGETVEIRCALVSEGDYSETRYTIRYFQPEGRGELWTGDGTLLVPNDRFPLVGREFNLYYTSLCSKSQSIDIYIEDNFGRVVQKSFSWQNESAADPVEE